MIFDSKKTNQLNKKHLFQIFNLKDEKWKFGTNSQKKFFKKNIKSFDIHNFIYKSKKKTELIGYTCFRLRNILLLEKKFDYLLLDTIVIGKKYRKKNYGQKLMKFNNKIIKKNKMPSFLFCNNKNAKFFRLFGWQLVPSKTYKFLGKNIKKQFCMSFNNKMIIKKKQILFFTI